MLLCKKDCTIRPSKPEIYDAYAYGYNSLPMREETFTGMSSESAFTWSTENENFVRENKANSIKIKQPISEFTKRGQYYSVFRIKHYTNGWATIPTFASSYNSTSSDMFYINNDINPVEFYNRKTGKWNTLYTASSTTSVTDSTVGAGYSNTTSILGATSASPIPINNTTSFNLSIDNSKNPKYTASYIIEDMPDLTPYKFSPSNTPQATTFDVKNYRTYINYYYTNGQASLRFFSNGSTTNSVGLRSDIIYTSDIKIPFSETIKIKSGYDYIILEALDLNSRAYIVPMYENKEKTKIKNQLVDILQIIEKTSFNLLYSNYVAHGSFSYSKLRKVNNVPDNICLPYLTYVPKGNNYIAVSLDSKDNKIISGTASGNPSYFDMYDYTIGTLFKPTNKIINLFTPESELLYDNGYGSEISTVFLNNDLALYYQTSNGTNNKDGLAYCYRSLNIPNYGQSYTYWSSSGKSIGNRNFPCCTSKENLSAVSASTIYGFPRNFDSIRIMELNGD